jgi:integrase
MGLTRRGKCSRNCEQGRKGLKCNCPKVWSYYVQFYVRVDNNTRTLSPKGQGAKLKRWRVPCDNKGIVRQQEAIIKAQLLTGQPLITEPRQPDLTMREYALKWLETGKGLLAIKTQANYYQLLKLYVLPLLGDRALRAITWADVRTLLNQRQHDGLSQNTIRLIRAVISTLLTDASEDGLILTNPVLGQRRKRRGSFTMQSDIAPLNWDQKQVFESKLREMEGGELLSPAYSMLLSTYLKAGLRPGEGRALQLGDIDFIGRRLRVQRAATLNRAIKNTKTGEIRWVDLSDGLLADLKTYITLRKAEDVAQGKESLWLFPSLTGTLLDESHVVRAFHRVLDAAGLPRFRVYDLRHTFASLLLSSNVPLLYVSQQLGHAKPTITLKYYARWIPSGLLHRVNILDTEDRSNPC